MDKSVLSGTVYIHGPWRYFVDQREDNGKFTAFMSSSQFGDDKTEVTGMDDFDTVEEAQNALDGFAEKRGFPAECFTPNEKTGMEQGGDDATTIENSDSAPNEKDVPEVEHGEEIPPCDWKNASGGDEGSEESEEEEPEKVSGDPLDLRGDEFDYIIKPANAALNRFVAMLHAKKQHDGEINIKVTFEDDGGSYIFGGAVSGKINLTMKPQKVTGDAVELQFDAQGNPIIPADREHQLNFDEIQPGQREIPPSGGTAIVDGQTGIVEEYQEDETEDSPESNEEENEDPDDEFPPFEDDAS